MTEDWTDSALRAHALRQQAARALRPSTCQRPARAPYSPASRVPGLSVLLALSIGLYLWSVLQ